MGASLAMSAFAHRKDLPDPAFRLLIHMALTCKDSDKDPKYWAGREGMALALGVELNPAGVQRIKRALSQLMKAGAVERIELGRNGRRSEYKLCITPPAEPLKGVFRGTPGVPLRGTHSDPL